MDVYKDWFKLGAHSPRQPMFDPAGRRSGMDKTQSKLGARTRASSGGGKAEKSFSGVDAYIRGLKKIGSMPVPRERQRLDFDNYDQHDFHRIPGYAGFVPGDKCKESVTMMRNGTETARLGALLSRTQGGVLSGGGYVDAPMPRTVNDEIWSFKVNPEPLTQFSRVRTDVWPTAKDSMTGV